MVSVGSHSSISKQESTSLASCTSSELEAYIVKLDAGDATQDVTSLRRIETRNTIISTLEQRAKQTCADAESYRSFEDLARTEDALPTKDDGAEFQELDPELVTWEGDDDPENPKNWTRKRKWISMSVVSAYTFLAPFASTMPSPAVGFIAQDFGVENKTLITLMVSVYLLAWAVFSPLVAPFSEMYGRKRVLDISTWILLVFNLACAFSKNLVQMCIFRFFAGVGGCAPVCIGIGVLSDLFISKDLATANTIYALGPVFGPCLSAMIAGIMMDHVHWRWTFYLLCIINGVVAIVGVFVLEESYAPALLKRKAKRLRKQTGNPNLKCIYEIATGETIVEKFYLNLRRPLELLFTNPMVFGLGIFMALTYGCLFILITTFPTVWRTSYNMSSTQIGLMYISLLIGYLSATVLNTRIASFTMNYLKKRNNGVAIPEHRLVLLVQAGILIPIALLWYGWGAEKKIHFIFPAIGAIFFAFSMVLVFFCISMYLIEMNPRFSASALAAVSIFRSFLGFCFPLFAPQLYAKMGYGWGCSMFGFIALLTGVPFPIFLMYYGKRMRGWASRRVEIQQAKRDAKYLARLRMKQEKENLAEKSVEIV